MNVFFVNHVVDFDFMAPLILESKEATVFLTDHSRFIERHPAYALVERSSPIRDVSQQISRFGNLRSRIANKLKKTNPQWSRRSVRKAVARRNSEITRKIFQIFSEDLSGENCKCFFAFSESDLWPAIQKGLVDRFLDKVQLVAIPHGFLTIMNKMVYLSDTQPPSAKYERDNLLDFYDKVIVNDEAQGELIQALFSGTRSKIEAIWGLRYTKKWSDTLSSQFISGPKNNAHGSRHRARVLFLHTKINANLFEAEVVRCLRMLSNLPQIHLTVRPHPRGLDEADALRKKSGCSFDIDLGHILEVLQTTDYVIGFPSTAMLDVFRLGVPFLFPQYATSSVLNPDLLRSVELIESPDRLYETLEQISKGIAISDTGAVEYQFPPDQSVTERWGKVLNSY